MPKDTRTLLEKLRDIANPKFNASPNEQAEARRRIEAMTGYAEPEPLRTTRVEFEATFESDYPPSFDEILRRFGAQAVCERCGDRLGSHIIWQTREGDRMFPCEMENGHLMAAIHTLENMERTRGSSIWLTERLDALMYEKERRDRTNEWRRRT